LTCDISACPLTCSTKASLLAKPSTHSPHLQESVGVAKVNSGADEEPPSE